MKLQFAMDALTTEAALELGTPLIKSAGLSAITVIKAAHPDKIVFADLKTMDAGELELEADVAFAAGAELVTVPCVAGDSTIAGAVKAGKGHGKGVVVDLIGVADMPKRAKEVVALGAEFVEMHAGLGEQAEEGFTFATLLRDGESSGVSFSVAGGINASTIASVQQSGARVAVAGGAICGAPDVGAAAAALRAAIV